MGYRIKTVSDITGIQRATLLAWERRFRLVAPTRHANGYREYSDSDLARLLSLKRLLDRGYKISEALSLMKGEGREGSSPRAAPARGACYAALHESIQQQLRASGLDQSGPILLRHAPDLESFLALDHEDPVQVIVISLPLLGEPEEQGLRRIRELNPDATLVLLYEFATRRQLARLSREPVRLVQGPVRIAGLVQLVAELAEEGPSSAPEPPPAPRAPEGEVPLPRISDEALGRLREIRTGIACECPNHLASILSSLRSFERYSQTCLTQDPEDAALHRWLAEGSGQARALLEDLLLRVCEQEQIRI